MDGLEPDLPWNQVQLGHGRTSKTREDLEPYSHLPSCHIAHSNPLTNPAFPLEDTFDSFTPTTLEQMVAQQEEPVMVSAASYDISEIFR